MTLSERWISARKKKKRFVWEQRSEKLTCVVNIMRSDMCYGPFTLNGKQGRLVEVNSRPWQESIKLLRKRKLRSTH